MRNNKSSLFGPQTMNLENIIARAVLRNIFNEIYVVIKSLEHDLEYKLLFPGLSLDLLYRPRLTSWLSNKCKYNLICSHPTYRLGEVILPGNFGTY